MVEGNGLENRRAGNGTEGSNPSLSAKQHKARTCHGCGLFSFPSFLPLKNWRAVRHWMHTKTGRDRLAHHAVVQNRLFAHWGISGVFICSDGRKKALEALTPAAT